MSGKLTWRSSPPTAPGFFFVRPFGCCARVVEFVRNGPRIEGGPSYLYRGNMPVAYAGPIQEPVEPDFLEAPETLTEERE